MNATAKRALMTHMTGKERREREMRDMPYRYGEEMRMGDGYRYHDGMRGVYSGMESYEPEMRRGRNNRGRYMSARDSYDGSRMGGYYDGMVREESMPYIPPVYERVERSEPRMHRIGFSVDGEMERLPQEEVRHDYRADATYSGGDEMMRRSGERTSGHGEGLAIPPMTQQLATQWLDNIENEDGSHGPHWSLEQTKQVMAQKNISCDPTEFWAAMNMMYSDYCGVAKKLGVNNMDFYSCMAKAFLDDKDAKPDKLARYYTYIVK